MGRLAACATVGTPGSAGDGLALVTASALSLPPLISAIDEGRLSNITCMVPPVRSVSAGPLPLYGKWTMKVLVCVLNSSPARWIDVPLPLEAMFSLPGLARA
ncbi:hypothetical protein D3C72_1867630 [compost metagenome]